MVKHRCRMLQRGVHAQPYNTQAISDRSRWSQCELWLPRDDPLAAARAQAVDAARSGGAAEL